MIHHNWCEHIPEANPLDNLAPQVLRHCLRCHMKEDGQWYKDHIGLWLIAWDTGTDQCKDGWDLGEAHSARTESWRWN